MIVFQAIKEFVLWRFWRGKKNPKWKPPSGILLSQMPQRERGRIFREEHSTKALPFLCFSLSSSDPVHTFFTKKHRQVSVYWENLFWSIDTIPTVLESPNNRLLEHYPRDECIWLDRGYSGRTIFYLFQGNAEMSLFVCSFVLVCGEWGDNESCEPGLFYPFGALTPAFPVWEH